MRALIGGARTRKCRGLRSSRTRKGRIEVNVESSQTAGTLGVSLSKEVKCRSLHCKKLKEKPTLHYSQPKARKEKFKLRQETGAFKVG